MTLFLVILLAEELTCDELQCDTNGECIENRNRMPECRCKRGYRGNGYYCQQVDEDSDAVAVDCRQPGVTCDVNAECAPNQYTQTYDCVCKSGYIGPGSYCVQNPDYCQYQCDDNSECVFNQTLREWTCVLKGNPSWRRFSETLQRKLSSFFQHPLFFARNEITRRMHRK